MKHLEKFNILSDVQHGFRAKGSTETQLILTIHDKAKAINGNKSVHAVVLDFAKAFDGSSSTFTTEIMVLWDTWFVI